MKRFVLAIALFVAYFIPMHAQHFAFIDMEYILKHIPAYQQAGQQMESQSKQWQAEIDGKAAEAKKLYEAYQAASATLNATQRTEKENAIVTKEKEVSELRKHYFGPDGEMAKLQKELTSPIQDAIYNAVKKIAVQKNYDAVVDRASAQSIIFASPSIDISNEVLSELGYSN